MRRVGLLLSSGANLEALAVELHAQAQQELTAAAAEAAEAAGASGGSSDGGEVAAGAGAAAGNSSGGSSEGSQGVELGTVRRMIEGVFSTSHTVYQRVQVGRAGEGAGVKREVRGRP